LAYLGNGALAVLSIASRSVACDLSVQLIVRQRILEHMRRLDEDDDYNREVQRQIEADWSSEHCSNLSWLGDCARGFAQIILAAAVSCDIFGAVFRPPTTPSQCFGRRP
jgi:hypothetical protein